MVRDPDLDGALHLETAYHRPAGQNSVLCSEGSRSPLPAVTTTNLVRRHEPDLRTAAPWTLSARHRLVRARLARSGRNVSVTDRLRSISARA